MELGTDGVSMRFAAFANPSGSKSLDSHPAQLLLALRANISLSFASLVGSRHNSDRGEAVADLPCDHSESIAPCTLPVRVSKVGGVYALSQGCF